MFLIFKPVPGIQIVEGSVRSESGKKVRRRTGGEEGTLSPPTPPHHRFFLHCPINNDTWKRLLVFLIVLKLSGAPF